MKRIFHGTTNHLDAVQKISYRNAKFARYTFHLTSKLNEPIVSCLCRFISQKLSVTIYCTLFFL